MNIQYVEETGELMGTAGSVKLAEPLIKDSEFIVYYGDNLTSMDFAKFLRFHKLKHSLATAALRSSPPNYRASSIILLDPNSRIKTFLEKPSEEDYQNYANEKMYINSGIYLFSKKIFELIPSRQKYDFAMDLFPKLVDQKEAFYGYPTAEFFREIGRVEKYQAFLLEVKGKENIFEQFSQKKAVFLDRDGVINENGFNISTPDKLIMIEGAAEAIKKLNDLGYLTIIVTNQPEIAKGFFTVEDFNKVNQYMAKLLAEKGAHIDHIYFCPHHPERGFPGEVPELKMKCFCRKPEPGMLLRAIKDHGIDVKRSWMIGDSKSDIIAGQKVGVKTILITSGGGSGSAQEEELECKPDFECKDLKEAVEMIL
jgi:D,D-heptose 1,7-bisphosphate phosphatase